MRQMARELMAIMAIIPEGEPSAELEKLAARVAVFTDPHRREAVAAQEYRSQLQAADNELNQLIQDVSLQLREILGFDTHTDSGNAANKKLGIVDFPPYSWFSTGISLLPPGRQPTVKVLIATAMRIPRKREPVRCRFLNVARLESGAEDITEVWSATYEGILIGSASQANAFAFIRTGLVSSFEPKLCERSLRFWRKPEMIVRDGWQGGALVSSPPNDLRGCHGALLAGRKARASFMFAGCCRWQDVGC